MMTPLRLLATLAALLAVLVAGQAAMPRAIGSFDCTNPAFFLLHNGSLLVTAFTGSPFSKGRLQTVPNFVDTWKGGDVSSASCVSLTPMNWPNIPTVAPPSLFNGGANGYLVPDGFLVPLKSTGNVYYVSPDQGWKPQPLIAKKSGYFYHRVFPFDVDGDGDLDLVTARATKPLLKKGGSGELLWLERTADGQFVEHVVTAGPDVIFDVHPASTPGNLTIAACEFFSTRVTWNVLDHGKLTKREMVDTTIGAPEACRFADLRNDGSLFLLVSNHVDDEQLSGLFAYEVPSFNRTTLAQGMFKVRSDTPHSAAPGFPFPFHPTAAHKAAGEPPHIALAGDGTNSAFILEPSAPLKYTVTQLVDPDGTVGSMLVGDFDADGATDIVVPDYDHSKLYGFTYAGTAAPLAAGAA
mmetsp:Transcript_8340/g.21037  ORF Transcript_8340/g.21037 Transcript_8340/m.21037 type:complete len:410 (+) Transcript_8340:248-1477(+)